MRYTNPVLNTFIPKDGDTFGLAIGLSGTISENIVARLNGWDCPELKRRKCGTCGLYASPYEIRKATEAWQLTNDFIYSQGQLSSIREERRDAFGRELVELHHEIDGIVTDLGFALMDANLATSWPNRWHERFDPDRNKT